MGVHIYSGSLIRFYTNDWENEIQRWARENGATYSSSGGRTEWPTAADARRHLEWMRQALRERFGELDWNDDIDGYDTKKLHQEGRDALSIVSAHLHRPDLPMPDELPADVRTDVAYAEAGKKGYLIGPIAAIDASVIIPGGFEGLSFIESPLREEVLVCSSQFLKNALQFLSDKYWEGAVQPDAWLERGLVYGRGAGDVPRDSLRGDAEYAFGVYTRMLEFSARNRCPIAIW